MKKLILLAFALFCATPTYANTEYRCLDLCRQAGKPAGDCMSVCTYTAKRASVTKDPVASVLGNHRVFTPMQMAGDNVTVNKDAPKPQPHKDYACFNQCLQTHIAYDMCDQGCTSLTLPNGKLLAVPGAAAVDAKTGRPQLVEILENAKKPRIEKPLTNQAQ